MDVGELAAAGGVSVRTLHHWDAVGLLVPSGRTRAGYRSYDAGDLDRLRQVLVYRELGFSLQEVRRLLDDPAVDVAAHLRRQQALLADRIARLQVVAALVQRAVEETAVDEDLADVFGGQDPQRFEAEVIERWGETDAYRQAQERGGDRQEVHDAGRALEQRFAEALAAGVPATDCGALVEQHRAWVGLSYDCTPAMQVALAELYLSDERFRAHYDAVAPGLAQYVHDAVQAAAR